MKRGAQTARQGREATFTMRASAEEVEMLRELASDRGLTASDVLRVYIRESHRARFGDRRPHSAGAR